jgi:uncharacterized protein
MRFTQDQTSSVNVIRGYGNGEIRINAEVFESAVIVGASAIRTEVSINSVTDLTEQHVAHILLLEPEVVLLGTGARQVFPAPSFGVQFLRTGIGFEVMDTGAACRTFNVLVSEQRRVVALLLI